MKGGKEYLFTSRRLGFRNWEERDLEPMSKINADPRAMQYFPETQTALETEAFIRRMQKLYREKGYCYFAVDLLGTNELIGFIGLNLQTFKSDFTPCVDLGWRLHPNCWGKGYATEGALRCINYARKDLLLKELMAMAPKLNTRSIRVMQKIGMTHLRDFQHPGIEKEHPLQICVLYRLIIK